MNRLGSTRILQPGCSQHQAEPGHDVEGVLTFLQYSAPPWLLNAMKLTCNNLRDERLFWVGSGCSLKC